MNWKTYVEKKNADTYVLPPFWDSRETIAAQLECSPEKVDDNLRPGLRSGEIQKQQFRVWDKDIKRIVPVVAYAETAKVNGGARPKTDDAFAKIKELKRAGKSWAKVGSAVGMSGEAARAIYRRGV